MMPKHLKKAITKKERFDWVASKLPSCEVHEIQMEPFSRGVFQSESGKRIAYEVLFHCVEHGCTKIRLKEWYIKGREIAYWDMMFFGHVIDAEPFDGESFNAFRDRMEGLYVAFGVAQSPEPLPDWLDLSGGD